LRSVQCTDAFRFRCPLKGSDHDHDDPTGDRCDHGRAHDTHGAARAADIPFGTGADERADLQAKEKDYNLKIVAAATSGDYLAGVRLVIESAANMSVLETRMDGSILLAKLPTDTYTIKATYGPSTQTRTVNIPGQGLREAQFRWPVPLSPKVRVDSVGPRAHHVTTTGPARRHLIQGVP
jgi:hypothetical protein